MAIMKYVLEMNEHEKTELLTQIEERRKQHVADLETALFNLKNNPMEFEESEIKKYNQRVKENNKKILRMWEKMHTRNGKAEIQLW